MSRDGMEVVLAASSIEANIGVWDVNTATFLTTFKGNQSGRNALSRLGKDHIVAAQAGKNQPLHFWTWHKDQVHQRSFMPQTMSCLASTPDGVYCTAGSDKGSVYIWEAGSGRLLRTWTAHYKAVNAMVFTDDGSILVTGGEDATVAAWLMMEVLNVQNQQNAWDAGPQPMQSCSPGQVHFLHGIHKGSGGSNFLERHSSCLQMLTHACTSRSEHTLPVTAIAIGAGTGNTIVASASLDHSCKIWSLATGHLLRSIALPASLHSIVLDPWEHSIYLGSGNGRIFEVALTGQGQDAEEASRQLAAPIASASEQNYETLTGHTQTVNCLATTSNGFQLVSGSDDASIRVWDMQSRQCLRSISARGPVTGILVCRAPPHMTVGKGTRLGKTGPKRPEALSVFSKHLTSNSERPWEGPPIILDGTQQYRGVVLESQLLAESNSSSMMTSREANGHTPQEQNAENKELREKLDSAMKTIADLRSVNSKLHAFVVDSSLGGTGKKS